MNPNCARGMFIVARLHMAETGSPIAASRSPCSWQETCSNRRQWLAITVRSHLVAEFLNDPLRPTTRQVEWPGRVGNVR